MPVGWDDFEVPAGGKLPGIEAGDRRTAPHQYSRRSPEQDAQVGAQDQVERRTGKVNPEGKRTRQPGRTGDPDPTGLSGSGGAVQQLTKGDASREWGKDAGGRHASRYEGATGALVPDDCR